MLLFSYFKWFQITQLFRFSSSLVIKMENLLIKVLIVNLFWNTPVEYKSSMYEILFVHKCREWISEHGDSRDVTDGRRFFRWAVYLVNLRHFWIIYNIICFFKQSENRDFFSLCLEKLYVETRAKMSVSFYIKHTHTET